MKKYRLRDGDIVSLGVHDLVYQDLRSIDDVLEDQLDEPEDDDEDLDDLDDEQETA